MKSLKNIFWGLISSTILTIIFILIFSLILTKTNINESYINIVIMIIFGVCILVGTTISTRKIEKNGALIGATMALLYIIVLYIISSLLLHDFSLNINSIWMIISAIMLGSIGGIIGVNINWYFL